MKQILTHMGAFLAGVGLVAGIVIGFDDARDKHSALLIDQLFLAKSDMQAIAVELEALRDSGACAGVPITAVGQVGKILVMHGPGIVAMQEQN